MYCCYDVHHRRCLPLASFANVANVIVLFPALHIEKSGIASRLQRRRYVADDPVHELSLQPDGITYYRGARPQIGVSRMDTGETLHGDRSHVPQEGFLHEGFFFPPTSQSGGTSAVPGVTYI